MIDANLRVLNVEDSEEDSELILRQLRKGGYEPSYLRVQTAGEMSKALKDESWDVIIADYHLPRFSGPEALEVLRDLGMDIPFILISGRVGDERAVEVMKLGASDYLLKDNLTRLVPSVEREIREARNRMERNRTAEELRRLSLAVRMSSDGICVHDLEGRIVDVNRAFEVLCGAGGKGALLNTSIVELLAPEYKRKGMLALKRLVDRGAMDTLECEFVRLDGERVFLEVSASLMKNEKGAAEGFVSISRDITERKRAEWQMKRSLMNYDLRDGLLYLVKEASPVISVKAFRDLVTVGYEGTHITRSPPLGDRQGGEDGVRVLWLSENGHGDGLKPTPESIVSWFSGRPRRQAVLIDRLDFVMSRAGFDGTLSLVQYLRELCYMEDHIVLLSLDPRTMEDVELRRLEKETALVEPMERKHLREDLMEALRTVYEHNIRGSKPSHITLCAELKVSRPTVRKRLRDLVFSGHVLESAKGRTKVVEITEKGRAIFRT